MNLQMSGHTASVNPRETSAWPALEKHASEIRSVSLSTLLDQADREQIFSASFDELWLDYSRCHADRRTLELLLGLAREVDLAGSVDALFAGEKVNKSENRPALHTELRASVSSGVEIDGSSVHDMVMAERQRFFQFADTVRSGERTGFDGARIRRVINVGIGGSDLGPRMISHALAEPSAPLDVLYVAGLDGIELSRALEGADPASTLFIVCSKTFTTLETRTNADAARAWLLGRLPEEALATNFAAVSANDAALDEFGIVADARFRMWDWVGGRYSVWSAIGLAAAMTTGSKIFLELLEGAAAMDQHFRTAPYESNLPVVSALLGIWAQNFMGANQKVVLPYDQRLELLPDYLQQLVMESEGKSVRQDGSVVDYSTGASLWGGSGSNAQHSFAQWLHQGSGDAHVDYIGTVNGWSDATEGAHLQALGNMIAQAEVLARGQNEADLRSMLAQEAMDADEIDRLAAQKAHAGGRAATILLLRELSARNLGMLLAFYEHQVYTQAVIWGINPFDQWGVELGKQRAREYSGYLLAGDMDKLPAAGRQILVWKNS
jgi:glucose-6-phosphate isomerase